jgi:hypothetical protein
MSTHVNDLASGVAVYAALPPAVRTASANGAAIDMLSADGPCFAVQQVGTISAGATWDGALQESANGVAWTAIGGAEFASVGTSGDLQTDHLPPHQAVRAVRRHRRRLVPVGARRRGRRPGVEDLLVQSKVGTSQVVKVEDLSAKVFDFTTCDVPTFDFSEGEA